MTFLRLCDSIVKHKQFKNPMESRGCFYTFRPLKRDISYIAKRSVMCRNLEIAQPNKKMNVHVPYINMKPSSGGRRPGSALIGHGSVSSTYSAKNVILVY